MLDGITFQLAVFLWGLPSAGLIRSAGAETVIVADSE